MIEFLRRILRRRRQIQMAGDNSVQIQMRATNGGTVAYHIDTVEIRRRADDE